MILLGFESPLEHQKNLLAFLAGRFFSGRARGVEVYPRQGKSPLEHQKSLLAFLAGIFFPVAPGESKFIPGRGNPRWSTKKSPSPFGGGYFFWLLYCAIAIVRLRWHVIIIHNNIHIRIEPAGILQKIRV